MGVTGLLKVKNQSFDLIIGTGEAHRSEFRNGNRLSGPLPVNWAVDLSACPVHSPWLKTMKSRVDITACQTRLSAGS